MSGKFKRGIATALIILLVGTMLASMIVPYLFM